jgi:CelD/BcsL family acetyltransferase involved in cellulose biosynthesis
VNIAHTAALPRWTDLSRDFAPELSFFIYKDFAAAESEWRNFQASAEATPFQSFEWLSAWQRHIGTREGVVPAIIVGRFANGETAFILPLGVETRRNAKRLCWLGQELGDYNAPLLARDFSQRIAAGRFLALWEELQKQMQSDPELRYDWIEFEKMPQTVGVQINPFTHLNVAPNANNAYITQLGDDWDTFYRAKRSSATRRRDRAKRKRMSEFGEIRFITDAAPTTCGRHSIRCGHRKSSSSRAGASPTCSRSSAIATSSTILRRIRRRSISFTSAGSRSATAPRQRISR